MHTLREPTDHARAADRLIARTVRRAERRRVLLLVCGWAGVLLCWASAAAILLVSLLAFVLGLPEAAERVLALFG